jgi:multidrug efflux system membrane fusion protein
LRKGKKLSVDAYDREQTHKLASGSLLTLDNMIDTTTGTLKLKAVFPNTDNALFPSQFVNARILVDTLQNVTLIPTPAIQRNAQGAFVYVVKSDQTVGLQLVTPGTTDGTLTTVDGLQPGATVAVNGFDKLQEGAKVSVRAPSNANGAGQSSKGRQATPDQSGKQDGKAPSSKQGGSAQ